MEQDKGLPTSFDEREAPVKVGNLHDMLNIRDLLAINLDSSIFDACSKMICTHISNRLCR